MITVLSKVWDSVSGGVTERFLGRLLGPALLFWAVGGLAFAWNRQLGPPELVERVKAVPLTDGVAFAVVGGILLISSNGVMEVLQRGILRGLEGYWPGPLQRPLLKRVARVRRTVASERQEWETLAATYEHHTPQERLRYRQLDRKLAYIPENDHQLKPTIIGNVLAAAESYPWARYGLASVLMWPRLWLVMDEGSRNEVTSARNRLNVAVKLFGWSALSLVWVVWAWWALLVASSGLLITYRLAVGAAGGYGELIKSSFDVCHRSLLQRVGLLKEGEAFVPYERGRSLTMFVRRGIRPAAPPTPQIDDPTS